MPFYIPRIKPNILFNDRFSNSELWPQSCINENVLEDKSVNINRFGISKKPFVIEGKLEVINWDTINQKAIIGTIVTIIW